MNNSTSKPYISFVIPAYNEEGNITRLVHSISKVALQYNHEILVVNDGSTDKTFQEITELKSQIQNLSIINLRRNFGQTAALAAGIDFAHGEIIIPLDADGQNDPSDIPRLVNKINEGYDVVSGWRKNRKDPFLSRRLPSIIANALISSVTGVYLHDYGCTLKAYRHTVLHDLQIAGEMHRFLPAWCVWQGGRVTEIEVTHHPRTFGKSKYGMIRIFKVIIDLVTLKFFSGYLFKPNYLFTGSALVFMFAGLLSGLFPFYDKFFLQQYGNLRIPLLLLSSFLILLAVLLVLMGLIAELLVRVYFEIRRQKPYRLADE